MYQTCACQVFTVYFYLSDVVEKHVKSCPIVNSISWFFCHWMWHTQIPALVKTVC